jgi:hypothetical protein
MSFVVVTSCTNRKRFQSSEALQARSLHRGLLEDVAHQWVERVKADPGQTPTVDLYQGRGFQEAVKASSSSDGAMFVLSAGLGIVREDQLIPAYSLTLTAGSADSVQEKIVRSIHPTEWWEALSSAWDQPTPFADLARDFPKRRVLVACSEIYAQMISRDIEILPETERRRVRLFGPRKPSRLSPILQPLVMPYDERFDGNDGPLRGTRSDFPQRALRHFVEHLMPETSVLDDPEYDATLIKKAHESWKLLERPKRQPKSDEQILDVISNLWERAQGRSGRMLRVLRDEELIACEQGRFAALFKQVKERHAL